MKAIKEFYKEVEKEESIREGLYWEVIDLLQSHIDFELSDVTELWLNVFKKEVLFTVKTHGNYKLTYLYSIESDVLELAKISGGN